MDFKAQYEEDMSPIHAAQLEEKEIAATLNKVYSYKLKIICLV
jgi:hypothetical protein